ncbi:MAG: SRPBCC family protein [Acidobacteria bacterium]|nr:SRPBCC family protein [Acidobacteriota bacterium]MCA1643498.1 SRPBCC family protein [Acidobacteriota bacterium]
MPKIHLETFIAAPAEACFDLCLNVNAHERAGHGRAVAGVTSGQMLLGDMVMWEGMHFFVRQRLTSKIVAYERPLMFVDEMQRGALARWRHTHRFAAQPGGTLMVDNVDFASPLGVLGKIVDALVMRGYMTRFLIRGNAHFKCEAEARAKDQAGKGASPTGNVDTTHKAGSQSA